MEAEQFFSLVNGQRGHFLYESGYHSDTWFDLETLCSRPSAIRPFILEVCEQLDEWKPEVICGPLIEGGFIALLVAMELNRPFVYTLRIAEEPGDRMFPVAYDLPRVLTPMVAGKKVAVVNDVISAGSAVRGTVQNLEKNRASVVGVASLVVLGGSFYEFAERKGIPVRTLLRMNNNIWEPQTCPLCVARVPLQKLAEH